MNNYQSIPAEVDHLTLISNLQLAGKALEELSRLKAIASLSLIENDAESHSITHIIGHYVIESAEKLVKFSYRTEARIKELESIAISPVTNAQAA